MLFHHIHTYVVAAQTVLVSLVSTLVALTFAALPSHSSSAARSLLAASIPFAGLLRPAMELPTTRNSVRLLLASLRFGPVAFFTHSLVFSELNDDACDKEIENNTNYNVQTDATNVKCYGCINDIYRSELPLQTPREPGHRLDLLRCLSCRALDSSFRRHLVESLYRKPK